MNPYFFSGLLEDLQAAAYHSAGYALSRLASLLLNNRPHHMGELAGIAPVAEVLLNATVETFGREGGAKYWRNIAKGIMNTPGVTVE